MAINREQLLSKPVRRYTEVEIYGEKYRLQSLTELERSDYEIAALDKNGKVQVQNLRKTRQMLIAKCLVDDEGKRLFDDKEMHYIGALDGGICGLLYKEAMRHCGYDKDDVEAIEKNSEEATG